MPRTCERPGGRRCHRAFGAEGRPGLTGPQEVGACNFLCELGAVDSAREIGIREGLEHVRGRGVPPQDRDSSRRGAATRIEWPRQTRRCCSAATTSAFSKARSIVSLASAARSNWREPRYAAKSWLLIRARRLASPAASSARTSARLSSARMSALVSHLTSCSFFSSARRSASFSMPYEGAVGFHGRQFRAQFRTAQLGHERLVGQGRPNLGVGQELHGVGIREQRGKGLALQEALNGRVANPWRRPPSSAARYSAWPGQPWPGCCRWSAGSPSPGRSPESRRPRPPGPTSLSSSLLLHTGWQHGGRPPAGDSQPPSPPAGVPGEARDRRSSVRSVRRRAADRPGSASLSTPSKQPGAELLARGVESRFHGLRRDVEGRRDLLVGELREVSQHHDLPIGWRQLQDRGLDPSPPLTGLSSLEGPA